MYYCVMWKKRRNSQDRGSKAGLMYPEGSQSLHQMQTGLLEMQTVSSSNSGLVPLQVFSSSIYLAQKGPGAVRGRRELGWRC
jgi:hypothetical protein